MWCEARVPCGRRRAGGGGSEEESPGVDGAAEGPGGEGWGAGLERYAVRAAYDGRLYRLCRRDRIKTGLRSVWKESEAGQMYVITNVCCCLIGGGDRR